MHISRPYHQASSLGLSRYGRGWAEPGRGRFGRKGVGWSGQWLAEWANVTKDGLGCCEFKRCGLGLGWMGVYAWVLCGLVDRVHLPLLGDLDYTTHCSLLTTHHSLLFPHYFGLASHCLIICPIFRNRNSFSSRTSRNTRKSRTAPVPAPPPPEETTETECSSVGSGGG